MKSLGLFFLLLGIALSIPSPKRVNEIRQRLKNAEAQKEGLPHITKIVGGEARPIEERPYHLQLDLAEFGEFFIYYCGAVVIGRNSVLTAAHCTKTILSEDPDAPARILSGSNVVDEGIIHRVISRVVHPDFADDRLIPINDIAFLTVDPAFAFSNKTRAIAVAKKQPNVGDIGMISGWGETMNDYSPKFLMNTSVPVIDQLNCVSWYEQYGYNETGSFCAGYPLHHQDFCDGDSGGPLVMNDEVVGIASYRYDCTEIFSPGVYTNVAHFEPWISSLLDKAERELDERLSKQ